VGVAAKTSTAGSTTAETYSSANAVKPTSTLTNTTTTTTTNTATNSVNKSMTPMQMNFIISGLDAATKAYIEHKVRKHLPPMMKAADPVIQQMCTLFIADLETLRIQAKADYQVLLMEQSQFIEKNKDKLPAVEKQGQIMKLFQTEAEATKADNDLANTQRALQQMADAHHRLALSKEKKPVGFASDTGDRHEPK
jgi:hypothetical protein